MFAALEADRFDIVANEVTISDERKPKYDLSEPYSIAEGVIVTRKPTTTRSSRWPTSRARRTARRSPATGPRSPATPAPRSESVEGFAQAITLLNHGRVDAVVNDSIAVLRLSRRDTPTPRSRSPRARARRASRAFAARKDSGLLPELNKAHRRTARRRARWPRSREKYLKADATCRRAPRPARGRAAIRSAWQLVLDNLWPLAQGRASTADHSADDHQLRGRPGHRARRWRWRGCRRTSSSPTSARFYISIIRGTPLLVQLFIVFYALPQFGVKIDPFPAAVIAFSPQRRWLRGGDHPLGDPEHPEGAVGGRRDHRPQLRRRAAAHHPAAGHPRCGAAAVEYVDLAGEGHVAGVDHPGHRAVPARRRSSPRRRSSSSRSTARRRCTTG